MHLNPLRLDVDALAGGYSPWPLYEPIVKQHCRIDSDDEDDVLQVCLNAAILWVEHATHRTLFKRGHRWVISEFPNCGRQGIRLPRGKTVSVTQIDYVAGGTTTTLKGPTSSPVGSSYQEDLRGDDGGLLMPPQGSSWPSVDYDVPSPVTVTFVAGYDVIPQELFHAILLGTSDYFEMRGSGDFAAMALADVGKTLAVRQSLVSGWELSRWY